MSWQTRLRTAAGLWCVPLAVLLGLGLASPASVDTMLLPISRLAMQDLPSVLLLQGPVALAAAWEGRRLRRGRVLELLHRRSAARALVTPWLWSWLPSAVVVGAAMVRHGALDIAEGPWLVAVVLAGLAAWALAGMALGLRIPAAIALPVALAVPTLWFAMAPAVLAPWPRTMAGYLTCCQLPRTLDPRAWWSPLLCTGAIALAALGTLVLSVGGARCHGMRRVAALLAALLVGVLIGSSYRLAEGLGADQSRPRPVALTCHAVEGVSICLLPEHEVRSEDLVRVAGPAVRTWRTHALPLPRLLTEASTLPAGARQVSIDQPRDDQILTAVAAAMTQPGCAPPDGHRGLELLQSQQRTEAWLLLDASRPTLVSTLDRATVGLDAEAWAWADAMVRRPAAVQHSAITRELALLATC